MLPLASKLVDTDALLHVVVASLILGIGATATFSLGIVGAARFVDMRRAGREMTASAYAVLAVVAAAVCVALVAYGIGVMLDK
jgi:hypothetical protein